MTTPTPSPDVRELAIAAIISSTAVRGGLHVPAGQLADAVLAAVSPAIRRQERDKIGDELGEEAARRRAEDWPLKVGIDYVNGWEDAGSWVEQRAAAIARTHAHPEEGE